jgi:hypothetical protein
MRPQTSSERGELRVRRQFIDCRLAKDFQASAYEKVVNISGRSDSTALMPNPEEGGLEKRVFISKRSCCMNGKRMTTQALRVALYARVASNRQAPEGTIDSQVSAIRARIDADGQVLEPKMVFCDDGVSGATLARPALERLRGQAAAGTIDRLYVLKPDRLARRHDHLMALMEELQGCGVVLIFANRPLGTTPEGKSSLAKGVAA